MQTAILTAVCWPNEIKGPPPWGLSASPTLGLSCLAMAVTGRFSGCAGEKPRAFFPHNSNPCTSKTATVGHHGLVGKEVMVVGHGQGVHHHQKGNMVAIAVITQSNSDQVKVMVPLLPRTLLNQPHHNNSPFMGIPLMLLVAVGLTAVVLVVVVPTAVQLAVEVHQLMTSSLAQPKARYSIWPY